MSAIRSSWKFSSSIRHIHIMIFWDVMSYNLAGRNQHFEGNYTYHHLLWRWRKQVPPKRCYLATNLHSATFQKPAILIFTTARTSHLKRYVLCNGQNNEYTEVNNKWKIRTSYRSAPCLVLFVCWGLVLTEETWIVSFEWVFTDLKVICSRFIPWNLT
jgi:hypothetical protein